MLVPKQIADEMWQDAIDKAAGLDGERTKKLK